MPQIVTFAAKQVKKHNLVSVLCSLCVEYMIVRSWRHLETGKLIPVLCIIQYITGKHIDNTTHHSVACTLRTLEFVLQELVHGGCGFREVNLHLLPPVEDRAVT